MFLYNIVTIYISWLDIFLDHFRNSSPVQVWLFSFLELGSKGNEVVSFFFCYLHSSLAKIDVFTRSLYLLLHYFFYDIYRTVFQVKAEINFLGSSSSNFSIYWIFLWRYLIEPPKVVYYWEKKKKKPNGHI